MNVHLSDAAEADLESIGDWIAKDSPMQAVSFIRELREACEQLGSMPNAFRLMQGHKESGIRQRSYGDYLIFYTIDARVEILHIMHGARDYEAILFPS